MINEAVYLGSARDFVQAKPESKTGTSNLYLATKLYQDLTAFRLGDNKIAPLINLEIERLNFMRGQSVSPKKDEYYLASLNALASTYSSHVASAEVQYRIAEFYNDQSNLYTVDQPETRWDKKKALAICKEAISQYPDSYGAQQCKRLALEIESKSLSSEIEIAYASQENGRVKLSYRNVDSAYVRIIQVPSKFYQNRRYYNDELIAELLEKEVTTELDFKL